MNPDDPGDPDRVALHARDVEFDWSQLPMHWIPGEPFATHWINFLHLVLPEGERWFVEVFKQALPLISDDRLAEDVRGFVGQEAMHAESHQGVIDHFDAHGLDTRPFVDQVRWMFRTTLGDRPLRGKRAESWLVQRLALIAAIEHITAFLGQWILDAEELDGAGADPTMLDLLRWHGAEEVEHRSVAYEVYQHVHGRYPQRCLAMVLATAVLTVLWVRGLRFLMASDPVLRGRRKPRWRDLIRTGRLGLTPSYRQLLGALPAFFRPGYDPSEHGSTARAVDYLATSPAALAAGQ
ncbi:metal-dependent hydrolase [Saccharopolyspora sp. TS4A08]|uniref:Metal-dependent hydrolase n=1 Tax=Saccharopolyspora ipomoeae TaxID=3042027 RepID=A0ABT6PIP7_9PSEU|nr:metal-dependent hydrolase [Saccharopolyspora sp. TS4A08]MDI2027871.1 metal-dependent hydrolase [Saccharopolyspora sp. TS4A08]